MADTKISNFTDGVTLNATDRIAGARSPFAAASDNIYITAPYIGTYLSKNTLAAGILTTSQPMTLTQTWNAGGVTFNALLVNVTSTASAAASTLADFQLAGVSGLKLATAGPTLTLKNISGTGNYTAFRVTNDNAQNAELQCPGSAVGQATLQNNAVLSATSGVVLLSDNSSASGGTKTVAIITGGYNNSPTLTVTGGNPGIVQVAGTLRIDQTPTAVSQAVDTTINSGADGAANIGHRISINANGTTYWIPCSATAF